MVERRRSNLKEPTPREQEAEAISKPYVRHAGDSDPLPAPVAGVSDMPEFLRRSFEEPGQRRSGEKRR